MLIVEVAITLFFLTLFFNSLYEYCEVKKFWQVTFVKSVEQMVILGVMLALCVILNRTSAFQSFNYLCFPDVNPADWDIEGYSMKDMRNGTVIPEVSVMMLDFYILLGLLGLIYAVFCWYTTLHVSLKLRKWNRFELEPENEVHLLDDPTDKVNFLLSRRSLVTPLMGRRHPLMNELRDPKNDFPFVAYLEEVFSQMVHIIYEIPTTGLLIMVLIAGVESWLQMSMASDPGSGNTSLGEQLIAVGLCAWAWGVLGVSIVFWLHLQRVFRLMTPPPATLLWYIDSKENLGGGLNPNGGCPEKHLFPPYKLIPYLKEAPKKNKLFHYWYGTFSPNQQEQLWFRWKNGPAAVTSIVQNVIFILAVFKAMLLRTLFFKMPTFAKHHIVYVLMASAPVFVCIFYVVPEIISLWLLTANTGLMINQAALKNVIKAHRGGSDELASSLVEMTHVATMKELLEHPDTRKAYATLLAQLYEAIFNDDERDLIRASWKIHNWDVSSGMNPTEVKECMEHLGIDDAEGVIGEWWLVFDLNASGHLGLPDFQRMICARHIIKYGLAEKDALAKLFQRHPSGITLVKYDAARLAEVLATFRIKEPRVQSLHLLRDTMYHQLEKQGKSPMEIQDALHALGMDNVEDISVTPAEIADYLFDAQTYRTRFNLKFLKMQQEKRDARKKAWEAVEAEEEQLEKEAADAKQAERNALIP